MSTAVLPSLAGLGFDIIRTPMWDTNVQQNVSGLEVRIGNQTYPRWQWDLGYNILRSTSAFTELQQLAGFFNARQGRFDTFLYQDVDDNAVTGQSIGTGDGSTTVFQLIRSFGGFFEPVLAPNTVTAVKLNGVTQSVGSYTITNWGTANVNGPGVIIFNTPPGNGVAITADFSYYFPVRMTEDSVSFTMFMSRYYSAKKFSFISVKN